MRPRSLGGTLKLTDAQRQALAELWNGPIERGFEFNRRVRANTLNVLVELKLVYLFEKYWHLTFAGRIVVRKLITEGVIVEKARGGGR